MKSKMFALLTMTLLSTLTVLAQNQKDEKFKVAGNCGMCKARIEKAAKTVEGVTSADWDKETDMLEVRFSPDKTDLHKINMAVAMAGHDTQMHRANDEAYDKLPACCHYERISYESIPEKKK